MDVDSVKTNKTIRLAFAAAVAIIVTYSASTQWAWLTALAPMAAEASIDPLAAARYQEYAPRDFTGERAIAENALPWQHETWSGDNTPYQKARQEIDSAVAIGKSPMHLARQYEAQADKNRKGPLDQFRWGYALWRTITPTSTSAEKQTNKLGIFFALSKIASPNTYDYARLRYLVSYQSSEQAPLGERLLQQHYQDVKVKAHLALDYTVPGPKPYTSRVKSRVIQLSEELIQADPKYPSYYAILAEAYAANYFMNGHHRQDGLAMTAALKKYLSLAKPTDSFYQPAKDRLSDMQQRLNKNG